METPFLQDIVVILGLSVGVLLLFQKIKLPTILGFLMTGILAGPHGLNLITESAHNVEMLAEIGVILLLFIIGLEFSLKSLAAIQKAVFLGGTWQVGVTILAAVLVGSSLGFSGAEAIFIGFLFSLSSTAIVLKLLQEKGEINSPHGKISLAILIFQDIIVVPMMLFTPLIAGKAENVTTTLLFLLMKGLFIIGFVILSARFVVPRLLYMVANTKSKELFILAIVVICFAVAWLTSSMGLSLALGAFLAGLIISESEYSHQATSNILPFRELFTSFFFVSIGMLLDVSFVFHHIPSVALFTLLTIVLKAAIAASAAAILRFPKRTSIMVGLSLFQVGEFAFILSKTGLANNLLSHTSYQYFLAISILTMAATPFLIAASDRISYVLLRAPLPFRQRRRLVRKARPLEASQVAETSYSDHIIIIGYGINGRNVAKAATRANIPYVIIELNPDTVRTERASGKPITYGDATGDVILHHVQIHKARVVVVAISDPAATKKIIVNIRSITQKAYIIIRTRFIQEMDENFKLGADEVIPEEFETSIEIFTRVLNKYLVPQNEIEAFTREIRADNYQMLRPSTNTGKPEKRLELDMPDMDISTLAVQQGNNAIVGKKIGESQIRKVFGITVLTIKRDNQFITEIHPDTRILQDDVLYVFGNPDAIARFSEKISI
ncbi:cation:proton antiporter [Rhodocytophaga aerolata]|uniref:Cation:proton antiporter n=1 Tax=Rhodocytophaga aerolata TaxID=455078 RepID=A0ABT8RAL8_9BACT|nr:cation:proton antiporter [Rhodocytophaga aerolata]MDO1449146.1 cation:proton antiporter [Rhodocytophaga aerolata]